MCQRDCVYELSTFPARSCAGLGHRAGPSVGKVIFYHAGLSSISLPLFLYLLWREAEEMISGRGKGGERDGKKGDSVENMHVTEPELRREQQRN